MLFLSVQYTSCLNSWSYFPDPREPSPQKQAMWSPTPQLDHPLFMYPPMFFNPSAHAYLSATAVSTDTNIKQTESLHIKRVKMEDSSNTCDTTTHSSVFSSSSSASSSSLSSSASSVSSTPLSPISPLPMHLQSTEIHPAFPYTNLTHFPYVDQHILAAYYKELLQSSPYHNIMIVPPSLVPIASGTQYDVYSALSSQADDSVSHNPEKLLPP